jgi:DDB1- and CUL4-associated factor 11
MQVRMYDTSNPYQWKYYKVRLYPLRSLIYSLLQSISAQDGGWTITDASLSHDNKWLTFASLSSSITLASTDPTDDSSSRALDFTRLDVTQQRAARTRIQQHFYLFSVRFSGDSRELVAGSGDNSIYVFDIERNATVLRIQGHADDVNAVCFGDKSSPHILYSGSDDTTIKVWDRRSLSGGRPAGVFLGHVEGVTYVDSKGDGYHAISNGKDQTAKLWDLRKMHSPEKADGIDPSEYSKGWDYRGGQYNGARWKPHPHDYSLVTFRGHAVERTLIRCHFSPSGSTDGRYIYSGSRDGRVYIWNLDATLKATLDVADSAAFLRGGRRREGDRYETVVRDVAWHPHAPIIAGRWHQAFDGGILTGIATAWCGYQSERGACAVYSWSDGVEEDESAEDKCRRYDAKLNPLGFEGCADRDSA